MTSHQQILRILLIVQTTLLGLSTIESLLLGSLVALIVPGTATVALVLAIGRIDRIPTWSRRTIRIVEWTVLVTAVINTLLAIFLNQRLLEPVAITTQIIAPIVILRLVRTSTTPPALPIREELAHGAH